MPNLILKTVSINKLVTYNIASVKKKFFDLYIIALKRVFFSEKQVTVKFRSFIEIVLT